MFVGRNLFGVSKSSFKIDQGQIVVFKDVPDVRHGKADIIIVFFQLGIKLLSFSMEIIPADGQIPRAGNGNNGITVAVLLNDGAFLFRQINDFLNIKLFLESVSEGAGSADQDERKKKGGKTFKHSKKPPKITNEPRQNQRSVPARC